MARLTPTAAQESSTFIADGVSSFSMAFGSDVATDSLVVVQVSRFAGGANTPLVASDCAKASGAASLGPVALDRQANVAGPNPCQAGVFSAPVTAGGGLTVRVSSPSSGYFSGAIGEYVDVDLSSTRVEDSNGGTGSGTPIVSGNAATSDAGLFAAACAIDSSGNPSVNPTPGNSFTPLFAEGDSTAHQCGAGARRFVSAATTTQGTWAISATENNGWAAVVVAYKGKDAGGDDDAIALESTLAVAVGGAAAAGVATQASSARTVPVGGIASADVAVQAASANPAPLGGGASAIVALVAGASGLVVLGGVATAAVSSAAVSSRSVPATGSAAAAVAVRTSSAQPVTIGGDSDAAVALQLVSVGAVLISGSASAGSGAFADSARAVTVGGAMTAGVRLQLNSTLPVSVVGEAAAKAAVRASSALPVSISAAAAAVVAARAASTSPIPIGGTITVTVRDPFPGTHLDEPLSIDFDDLTTAIDFDDLTTQLVFHQRGATVFELTILRGEVVAMTMTLRGRDPATGEFVPYDVSGAETIKLSAGRPGAPPIIDGKDLAPVNAPAGRVSYTPDPTETAVGGRYEALAVVAFPGTPKVVRKFPGSLVIRDAIA